MASVLCGRVRRAGQWGVVRTLVRVFSAADSSGSDEPYKHAPSHTSGGRTVWPDESMGPFGPQDQRFQLPGNVGFDCHLRGTELLQLSGPVHHTVPDLLSSPSSSERHEFVLAQFVGEYQVTAQCVGRAEHYFTHSSVECSTRSCPELLKRELELCFPSLPTTPITLMTLTQKNKVDEEQLLESFVTGAKEICFTLWRGGYWADFIHPSSGRAFFAEQTVDSDVLQHTGFHIEDQASCTVIHHTLKETRVLTLITNAPSNSLIMEKLQGLTD